MEFISSMRLWICRFKIMKIGTISALFLILFVCPLSAQATSWFKTSVGRTTSDRTSALVIDSSNRLHAVYSESSTGDLYYAMSSDGITWADHLVDSADTNLNPSIAVDASGGIHIAYKKYSTWNISSTWDIKYAYSSDGTTWTTKIVDSGDVSIGGNQNIALAVS